MFFFFADSTSASDLCLAMKAQCHEPLDFTFTSSLCYFTGNPRTVLQSNSLFGHYGLVYAQTTKAMFGKNIQLNQNTWVFLVVFFTLFNTLQYITTFLEESLKISHYIWAHACPRHCFFFFLTEISPWDFLYIKGSHHFCSLCVTVTVWSSLESSVGSVGMPISDN